MDVCTLKEILKKEYGISSEEEFYAAVKKSAGINLGIFTMPLRHGGMNEEQKTKTTNVA